MTHALLLTDLVDSTALTERLGLHEAAALGARHDRLARDLLAQFGGREIDKTDGFLFLFEDATAAADYALAYHRALKELELKARAGLHVGEVLLRENTPADIARGAKPVEVEGLAKPLAARVMGVAVGGQTLATAAAVEALGLGPIALNAEGRPDVTLTGRIAVSHGHWRLKGISEPLELFELAYAKDGRFEPPPDGAKAWRVVWTGDLWLPVRDIPRALPREWDTFVGRAADLGALSDRLDRGAGLVTVLGIGGTGKTRLVTHFGWTTLGRWPGGTWFCDLSEARGVDGIVSAVARALDVPLGKDDPVVQLGHAIAGRGECLVILDNFEQVARHAPETVQPWVSRAKDAQFIVTSREVLGLPGEHALALAPLPREDGVTLFHRRARQAQADFSPRPADDDAIEQLVALLDGLPLAIELAAARVRLMPPKTLLARMSERFKLLSSSGGRHTRQATLRGALDWSWDLLSADEQQALAQLSVFEGGFTLEAAEGVLALSELWPMDAAQALVDKSLVRRATDERFDLLVSVKEYAAEKLDVLRGRREAEARHAAWFAQLGGDEALEALDTHGGVARRRALTRELDNLIAACRRSVVEGAAEPAVALVQAAWQVLEMTGPAVQAVELAERVAAMPGLGAEAQATAATVRGHALWLAGRMDEARAHHEAALSVHRASSSDRTRDRRNEGLVLRDLGNLHRQQGRMDEAREHYDAALAIARASGPDRGRDRRIEGIVLGNLGLVHQQQGRTDEAREHFDAALAIAREVGDRLFEGYVLSNLGALHAEQGRMDEAREHFDAALAVAREVGNRRSEGITLGNLGLLQHQRGRMDEARHHYDAALAVHRDVGNRRFEGITLGNLGNLDLDQGRVDEARVHYDAALGVHREVGNRRFEGIVLGNLGLLHVQQGRLDEARAHYEAALAVVREVGDRRLEGIWLGNLGHLHLEQGRLDEARASLSDGEPRLREVRDRIELAKLLCARVRLEARAGDPDAARDVLAEATDLAASLQSGPDSALGQALAKARAALLPTPAEPTP
jgi:predicted ATPase/class 3 adenylate cyclase/Tfp pilus assembly protein PilF